MCPARAALPHTGSRPGSRYILRPFGILAPNVSSHPSTALVASGPPKDDPELLALPAPPKRERWLTVVVDDTGIGISADDMSRLFTKFFRSDDPRVQREAGSGLGLSLVREIVRLHGGTIDLQSEPDQGTHVTIALPVG